MNTPTPPQAPQAPPPAPAAPAGAITVNPAAYDAHPALSEAEAKTMADWARQDLSKNKITQAQGDKIFNDLNVPLDQRGTPIDLRTDEMKLLDTLSPVAKPEEFSIRYDLPMTPELKQFDTMARGWLHDAGFPAGLGNTLISVIDKTAQVTKGMSADQLEAYRQTQHRQLQRAHGEKLDERLRAADDMIDQLEQQRPGLRRVLASVGVGKNAMVWNLLIGHAPIYHARRKGR